MLSLVQRSSNWTLTLAAPTTFSQFLPVIESWRRHYNTIRPHAVPRYKPPAPEVFVPAFAAWPAALRRAAPPDTLAKRPTIN